MSSFFTAPASQRKRKRAGAAAPATSKRRNTATSGPRPQDGARARREREDSVTDIESEDDEEQRAQDHETADTSESDIENETAAERRLKLAERYLENLKGEVEETVGFDAADLDRDLIAERLKEDVAESKGRLYRRIASELSFSTAIHTTVRPDAGRSAVTAVAVCPPYFYTATKDSCVFALTCSQILNKPQIVNSASNRRYLLERTQHIVGGFGKLPGDPPDLYHSYLGLAALSLLDEPSLKAIDPAMCISKDAYRHLESLSWRREIIGVDMNSAGSTQPGGVSPTAPSDTSYMAMSGG